MTEYLFAGMEFYFNRRSNDVGEILSVCNFCFVFLGQNGASRDSDNRHLLVYDFVSLLCDVHRRK